MKALRQLAFEYFLPLPKFKAECLLAAASFMLVFFLKPLKDKVVKMDQQLFHLMRLIALFLTKGFLLFACTAQSGGVVQQHPVNHDAWTAILQQYVNDHGYVDYAALKENRKALDQYLDELKKGWPAENWSKEEKLSFWINAYNAFTLDLVLENYPVESIKDIGSKIQIPFVNTPWDIKFIEIGDKNIDLNYIEHSILRKEFDEPRIHFAIVCASESCPDLRREAYTADKLDQQLTEDARRFLADESKNKIKEDEVQLSKIFSWFKSDFTKQGSLIEFINNYSPLKISESAEVRSLEYDWSLNDQH